MNQNTDKSLTAMQRAYEYDTQYRTEYERRRNAEPSYRDYVYYKGRYVSKHDFTQPVDADALRAADRAAKQNATVAQVVQAITEQPTATQSNETFRKELIKVSGAILWGITMMGMILGAFFLGIYLINYMVEGMYSVGEKVAPFVFNYPFMLIASGGILLWVLIPDKVEGFCQRICNKIFRHKD